jgi:hypothetical protein
MLLGLLGAGVLGTATGGLWVLRSARLQALSPLASSFFSRDEKVDHFLTMYLILFRQMNIIYLALLFVFFYLIIEPDKANLYTSFQTSSCFVIIMFMQLCCIAVCVV